MKNWISLGNPNLVTINYIIDHNGNNNDGGGSRKSFSDIFYRKTWKIRIFRDHK